MTAGCACRGYKRCVRINNLATISLEVQISGETACPRTKCPGGHHILGGQLILRHRFNCNACLIKLADREARDGTPRVRGLDSVRNFVR